MKRLDPKDIVELVGMAAIVASLIFVGFQLRQDRDIAVAQVYTDYGDSHTQWIDLLSNNMDVWVRALDGEELSEGEQARFDALAMGYVVLQRSKYNRTVSLVGPNPQNVPRQMANFIYLHPGLLAWWQRNMEYQARRGTSGRFRDAVDDHISGMAEGSIEPVPFDSYIPRN